MTFQTFTGAQYLKIDIANNFGLDKEVWNDRIAWFDANETNLDDLLHKAAEPALFFAGVQAYREAKAGKPCHYPIALDATSSGLQLLACMTGDRKAAELCNVVDIGKRADSYTIIYLDMLEQVGESAKITRDDAKKAIMTALYGSTTQPKRVFGEGELYYIFQNTMAERAPAAWELNKAMLGIWNPKAYSNDWIMPDNFHVHVKVMDSIVENVHFLNKPYEVIRKVNKPMKEGRSLSANSTHSVDGMGVREIIRRCDYDPAQIGRVKRLCTTNLEYTPKADDAFKLVQTLWARYMQSGFLSARILYHLRETNIHLVDKQTILDMIETLPKKPFKVLTTHDCFRCLPNYGNDLRRQYNQFLSDVAKSNMLNYLLTQITGRVTQLPKMDDNLWKDILDSNYALS